MSEKKKYFYMLVGLPGSGKTTWRRNFVRLNSRLVPIVLSMDDLIEEEAKRRRSTYRKIFSEYADMAMKRVDEKAEKAYVRGQNVICDMTNLSRKSRKKKLEKVPEDYYKICIVVVEPERREWKRRLEKADKGISEDIISNMLNKYEYPSFNEGFQEIRNIKV